MDNKKEECKVALYIDCENIPFHKCGQIIEIANRYGNVIIKKVYADWTKPVVKPWVEEVKKWALKTEHQFPFASGKNSSDMAIVIDVLLKLFEKDIDVFVIASSDSDFTSLVLELKERNKQVIGIGNSSSSDAYKNSFNEFHFLDEAKVEEKTKTKTSKTKKVKAEEKDQIIPKEQLERLKFLIDDLLDSEGKAFLSRVTDSMRKMYPSFIPKNYKCKNMKEFIKKLLPEYECKVNTDNTTLYIEKKK